MSFAAPAKPSTTPFFTVPPPLTPISIKRLGISKPRRIAVDGVRRPKINAVTTPDEVLSPVEGKPDKNSFEWYKQWYPLRVAQYLESDRPHHAAFLGKDVVLWKDGSGRWNCFGDMCPHRRAPLSEGRVEADGTLLCAYHAWRFNGDGSCAGIPQSKSPQIEKTRCANQRACAEVYPCMERQGILWVWGESGPFAQVESKQKEPNIIPELEDPALKGRIIPPKWGITHLTYGWTHFMENVLDPTHVPVSHHGLIGNRYTDPQEIKITMLEKLSTDKGFSSDIADFNPPCQVRVKMGNLPNLSAGFLPADLILYATPTKPGHCVHIGAQLFISTENSKGAMNPFFQLLGSIPIWMMHALAPLFLFQDLTLLHRQERYKRKYAGDKSGIDAYFLQEESDRLVHLLWRWMVKHAGGGFPWPHPMSDDDIEIQPQEELFDVYKAHTSTCAICKKAVRNLKIVRGVFVGAAVLAFLKGAPWLLQHSHATGGIGNLAPLIAAVVFSGSAVGLTKLINQFYFHKFSHADNN